MIANNIEEDTCKVDISVSDGEIRKVYVHTSVSIKSIYNWL